MTDTTERAQAVWGFWLRWVLVAAVLPIVLLLAIGDVRGAFDVGGTDLGFWLFWLAVILFPIWLASIVIAQWYVLRRHVPQAGALALASTLSSAIVAAALFLAASVLVVEALEEAIDDAREEAVIEAAGGEAVASAMEEGVQEAVVNVVEDALEEAVEKVGGGAVASAFAEDMSEALEEGLGEVVEEAMLEALEDGSSEVMEEAVACFVEEANEDTWEAAGEGAVVSAMQEALDEAFLIDAVREAVASAMEEAGGGALVAYPKGIDIDEEAVLVGAVVVFFAAYGAITGVILVRRLRRPVKEQTSLPLRSPDRSKEMLRRSWKPFLAGWGLGIVIGIAAFAGSLSGNIGLSLLEVAGLFLASVALLIIRRSPLWVGITLGFWVATWVSFWLFALVFASAF